MHEGAEPFMSDTTLGLVLLLVAGIMNASFTLPMKFTRSWSWENTWLAWSIFALILLPPVVTALTVPHLGDVYRDYRKHVPMLIPFAGARARSGA